VAAKGTLIHDPELSIVCDVDEYCRGEWFVTRWLEPADPSKLKARPRSAFVLKNLAAELSFGGSDGISNRMNAGRERSLL